MTQDPIEDALRRYRPVGPPADLRARILEAPAPKRAWPWAAAAAALLAVTVASNALTWRLYAAAPVPDAPALVPTPAEVTLLREAGLHDLADRMTADLLAPAAGRSNDDPGQDDSIWP